MAKITADLAEQATKIIAEGMPIGPRLYPCACGAGRHAHGGDARAGKCEATGCRRYRADRLWSFVYAVVDADAMSLGDALREYDQRERAKHYRAHPRKPGEWSIGASDTGTCPKKIEYRNRPPADLIPAPEDKREATMGTVIHAEVTRQARALFPWRHFAMRVRIPGLDRDSELDMYDPITGVLTDYKTAGDWRWEILGDEGPTWDTWEQTLLYGLALEEMGYRIERCDLNYVKRCNGHDETFSMPYDRVAAERARDRLLGYAEALDRGIPLERTGTGPTTDALCRRCFARIHCWNMDAAKVLARSPENLTILGQSPDDAENAWAIEQKVEAAAARLAAQKKEDEAKALVDGIPPGRYGEDGKWEVYERPQAGTISYKSSFEQVRGYLDLPDGLRPAASAVEPIRGRGSMVTKVGKVRKATLDAEKKARAALDKKG